MNKIMLKHALAKILAFWPLALILLILAVVTEQPILLYGAIALPMYIGIAWYQHTDQYLKDTGQLQ